MAHRQIQQITLYEDISLQDLAIEVLDDLFQRPLSESPSPSSSVAVQRFEDAEAVAEPCLEVTLAKRPFVPESGEYERLRSHRRIEFMALARQRRDSRRFSPTPGAECASRIPPVGGIRLAHSLALLELCKYSVAHSRTRAPSRVMNFAGIQPVWLLAFSAAHRDTGLPPGSPCRQDHPLSGPPRAANPFPPWSSPFR